MKVEIKHQDDWKPFIKDRCLAKNHYLISHGAGLPDVGYMVDVISDTVFEDEEYQCVSYQGEESFLKEGLKHV